jgi:hypothetical protein
LAGRLHVDPDALDALAAGVDGFVEALWRGLVDLERRRES